MKRIVIILLALSLSIGMIVGALAELEDETLDLSTLRKYERVNTMCWVGDTLYILGDEGLYTWRHDSGASMLIDMKAAAPLRYIEQPPIDAEQKNTWEKAVHIIFSDGSSLYALHQYSGKIYVLEGQELVSWLTLPTTQFYTTGDNHAFRGINDLAWTGEQLYLLIGSDDSDRVDKTTLLAFNPTTEQMTPCNVEGVRQIGTAPDGKLLLTRTVGDDIEALALEVFHYDPVAGTEERQVNLDNAELIAGVTYNSTHNGLIYCLGQDIMRRADDGTTQVLSTLPLSMGGLSAKAQVSDSGIYAGASGQYVFIRDVAGDATAQKIELCVVGDINPNTIIQFSMANSDIIVRTVDVDTSASLQQTILTAGANIDLYVVKAPGPFIAMREKGYLAPMNENTALVDAVKKMYPAVQEALFVGDQLIGVPINVQAYSWTVNQTLWDEIGLGEVPTTYAALFEGLVHWEDDFVEDNPDYKFLDMDQDLTGFVMAMVREYILQNEKVDEPLTFDAPAFREALQAVVDNQYVIQDQAGKEGMPIISTYSMGFGVSSNDGEKAVMMLPPALGSGDRQALAASMEALVINPASEHKPEALRFAQFISEQMDMSMQYMLTPSLMEPARAGSYAENAAKLDGDIAALETQAQSASDDKKAEIADALTTKRIQRENLENFAWLISPESVTCYRTLAENLKIPYASHFLTDEENSGMATLEPIISKFCAQELSPSTVDAFIRELDGMAKMIYQEGQ